jgi:hypothetical protein
MSIREFGFELFYPPKIKTLDPPMLKATESCTGSFNFSLGILQASNSIAYRSIEFSDPVFELCPPKMKITRSNDTTLAPFLARNIGLIGRQTFS